MNAVRRAFLAATVVGSMLVGGVGGAMLYATTIGASAASPSPTPSSGSATTPGKFVPNEDLAHEAGESAAREAQENGGQVPTVP
ncbi:MAG TPA: hypothetical protein VKE27_10635 [Candidatus Dormibacteraeota bacterium]|nr:hypothetical protein [Candidatus Dormibacteraeota bacterium]